MDRNVRRCYHGCYSLRVALRKESVDRNVPHEEDHGGTDVALRKESVDRNPLAHASHTAITVALRKESVDRNVHDHVEILADVRSLSARRAWIEIYNGWAWAKTSRSRSPQGERG